MQIKNAWNITNRLVVLILLVCAVRLCINTIKFPSIPVAKLCQKLALILADVFFDQVICALGLWICFCRTAKGGHPAISVLNSAILRTYKSIAGLWKLVSATPQHCRLVYLRYIFFQVMELILGTDNKWNNLKNNSYTCTVCIHVCMYVYLSISRPQRKKNNDTKTAALLLRAKINEKIEDVPLSYRQVVIVDHC